MAFGLSDLERNYDKTVLLIITYKFWNAICPHNQTSAYGISSLPPTGYMYQPDTIDDNLTSCFEGRK